MTVFSKKLFPIFSVLLAGALAATPALASRKVNFNASAQTKINDLLVNSPTQSECRIMIQNAGSTKQSVTLTFAGTFSAPAGVATQTKYFDGAATSLGISSFSDTVTLCPTTDGTCGSQSMVEYVWLPPVIPANQAYTQELSCSGYITVDDYTTGSPGFVTATGSITSYQEANAGVGLGAGGGTGSITSYQEANAGVGLGAGGGTSKTVTTSPSTEVIMIGEGRPF